MFTFPTTLFNATAESDTFDLFTDFLFHSGLSAPTITSGKVEAMNDLSPGEHHFSDPGASVRPLWETNQINSLPAMRFNSTYRLPFASAWAQSTAGTAYAVIANHNASGTVNPLLNRSTAAALRLNVAGPTARAPAIYDNTTVTAWGTQSTAGAWETVCFGWDYSTATKYNRIQVGSGTVVEGTGGAGELANWLEFGFTTARAGCDWQCCFLGMMPSWRTDDQATAIRAALTSDFAL